MDRIVAITGVDFIIACTGPDRVIASSGIHRHIAIFMGLAGQIDKVITRTRINNFDITDGRIFRAIFMIAIKDDRVTAGRPDKGIDAGTAVKFIVTQAKAIKVGNIASTINARATGVIGTVARLTGTVCFELKNIVAITTRQGVCTVATAQGVVAATTFDCVITSTAANGVVTVTTINRIIAIATIDRVIPAATANAIVASTATDGIIPVATVDRIITIAAINGVISAAAANSIVTRSTTDGIFAVAAINRIVAVATAQRIIARCADIFDAFKVAWCQIINRHPGKSHRATRRQRDDRAIRPIRQKRLQIGPG